MRKQLARRPISGGRRGFPFFLHLGQLWFAIDRSAGGLVFEESGMDRAQKAESIETLKGVFDAAGAVVVTHNMGLTVAEMSDLRGRLRKEGAAFKVVKNRLAQKALNGGRAKRPARCSRARSASPMRRTPVSAAKVATQYAKDNEKFTIVGGMMGETVLDAKAVDALAKLPSLDQLRAKLVGLLQAPATRIAGVVQAPAAQLARVFSAYAAKDAA